jgi:PGF-pre-PGF domain-containing protein
MAGQTNYRKSTKKKGIISVSLTLFIILMLVFSGPASAVRIQMESPSGNYYSGKTVTFTVDVEFQTDDLIPISTINVSNLPKGDLSFSADGTQLSGSDDYDVTLTENTAAYRQGYGYGYDYGYGYGYNFGYGYGYGYDSSAGVPSKLTYEIKISNLPINTYNREATIEVITESNQHVFSATQDYKFNVIRKPSGGSSGGGVSNQYTQTQTMRNGVASFWGNIGETIPSIEIPGATGSITVEELSSNPTNVNVNKHAFFYLDINTGENANKGGTITFKVSTTSLADAGIDRNNIALYRFNNGNWEELATQWSKTVDGYEEYTAQTPGFSAFLIAEKGVAPTITATPTLTPAPTEGIEEPTPTSTKKGIPGFEAFGLITGVLTAAYIIMRKRG